MAPVCLKVSRGVAWVTASTALAGSWYPGDASGLATEVDGYLQLADPTRRPAGRPLIALAPQQVTNQQFAILLADVRDLPVQAFALIAPGRRNNFAGLVAGRIHALVAVPVTALLDHIQQAPDLGIEDTFGTVHSSTPSCLRSR